MPRQALCSPPTSPASSAERGLPPATFAPAFSMDPLLPQLDVPRWLGQASALRTSRSSVSASDSGQDSQPVTSSQEPRFPPHARASFYFSTLHWGSVPSHSLF